MTQVMTSTNRIAVGAIAVVALVLTLLLSFDLDKTREELKRTKEELNKTKKTLSQCKLKGSLLSALSLIGSGIGAAVVGTMPEKIKEQVWSKIPALTKALIEAKNQSPEPELHLLGHRPPPESEREKLDERIIQYYDAWSSYGHNAQVEICDIAKQSDLAK